MTDLLHIGLDVGSTTVKVVVLDNKLDIIEMSYRRHFSDTKKNCLRCFNRNYRKIHE